MMVIGWVVPFGEDTAATMRLRADEIRDIAIDSSQLNLLAMIFFIVRYADDGAKARCTFVHFPNTEGRQPGLTRGR